MARGRKATTICKCGGTFKNQGFTDSGKVLLKCNNCGKTKEVLREKLPEDIQQVILDNE